MATTDDRLERLGGLARVWSELYFYHPAVTVPDDRWEDLLVRAIPAVEVAATPAARSAGGPSGGEALGIGRCPDRPARA